jgi:hypothetical protein
MKARLTLIAALAVAIAPLTASAQEWVSNPDLSEGIGIRTGNLELHPSVGGEFGYDSNFLRASDREGKVESLKLRVTPSLTLSTLGKERRDSRTPPDVAVSAGAFASYFELFPLDSADSDLRKRRNVSIGADTKVDIFPARRVGFDLLGAYARIIDAEGNSDDLAGEGFNRDILRGGAGATWRPGGGLFEWRLGYSATYHKFENARYGLLDNLHHEIGTRGRWRFLPRSALLFNTTYTFVRYTHADTPHSDGDAIRSSVGFHGLVTYHLALMGMLGWASSFYQQRAGVISRGFDSLTASAEVRWFIQQRPNLEAATVASGISSVALGYNRSFANSYLGSFYQRDRGYVQFSTFLVGAIAGGLEFGVARVGFPDSNSGPAFEQLRIEGHAFAEYRFTDTLAFNATLRYNQVNSPVVAQEDLDYTRWQAYVGLRWFM